MHGGPLIVSDVMTHTVAAIGRGASFKEIVRMMQDWKASALPVLEGEGRVVGVVSEADLLPKEGVRDDEPDLTGSETAESGTAESGTDSGSSSPFARLHGHAPLAKADAVTAGDLMTAPAVTVRADATLAQAARTMARARVKRLPVVDDVGMLEGIVSRGDLLKVFLRGDEEIAEEVRRVLGSCCPAPLSAVSVDVEDGVVTLGGHLGDTSLVPVVARLARAVEGVVDVEFDLADEAAGTA
ncbi:CBS domain-containing protein [Streptomyces sp. RY43-2]|uniref:CBS domain-containing protein n=1 Tax=Streptomyces macrolidinus TaxID=2952607 RepID=A0ABT0ZF79_9ACTN|nr:CBS domain-containing protein [Streptomyces macrolidinus]MCN9242235.1 CBS domain-containing protein [Streptomyces macrolidinus]